MRRLLTGLAERPRFRVWGIVKPDQLDVAGADRGADGRGPHAAADGGAPGGARNLLPGPATCTRWSCRSGWGGKNSGGFLRLGLAHYNTAEEVDRTLAALDEL